MSINRLFSNVARPFVLPRPLITRTGAGISGNTFAITQIWRQSTRRQLNNPHFQPSQIPKSKTITKLNHERLNKAIVDSIHNQVIKDPNEGMGFTNFIFFLSNVIIVSIICYNVFKVYYKGEEVFIPVIISRLDEDQTVNYKEDIVFQNEIRYQLLKKLSKSENIWNQFKLPIFLSGEFKDLKVNLKELNYSIKGYKIRPLTPEDHRNFHELTYFTKTFKVKITRDTKPLKLNNMMEPLNNIPVINPKENSLRDLRLDVLGEVDITDNLNNSGQIVFRGELNNDHSRTWKFTKCHLIRLNDEGKKERIVLWEV
ncbi:hypothetical protein WICPIJ_008170 [Wickerhamomyces pijperi]|uniref:Uncharacterized protein n=1 Tax=Wickerhamomyces pijperi TaxID=599730 RepID=A0A9P8TJ89_WICPI|nr:hypothetical protein WICPIJ_008170 [Wickerhamomyces pijperi]